MAEDIRGRAEVSEENETGEPETPVHVETEEERELQGKTVREGKKPRRSLRSRYFRGRAGQKPAGQARLRKVSRKQGCNGSSREPEAKEVTPRKKKKGSLFLDLTASSEDNSGAQIQSAVRQVLDETEGK